MSLITRRQSLAAMAAVKFPTAGTRRRGVVAFHYAAVFTPREVAWYTRFENLVTGAILSPQQSDLLRGAPSSPTRLIAYEWSSAFYRGDSVSAALDWQRRAESRKASWLLTDQPVTGAAAENGRLAHWYDFGSDELVGERAAYLADLLERSRYDGFFFDTIGFQCLPPAVQKAFQARHPGVDYNQRQGVFLKKLRAAMRPSRIIFLNQGYRHAAHLLPHADLDLSESYFTYVDPRTGTGFRPWHDAGKPWESVRTPMEQLIAPAMKTFPRVRMVHVNYAGGSPGVVRSACRYADACARLFGHESYLIVPSSAALEEDDTYFTQVGKAIGPIEEDAARLVAWRRFEGGVVAVNSGLRPARIESLGINLPEPRQGYFVR